MTSGDGATQGSSMPPSPPATRTVQIPEEVARAMEARIAGSGFRTVDEFVSFVLARLAEQPGSEPFSADDERSLRERLRSLGYID